MAITLNKVTGATWGFDPGVLLDSQEKVLLGARECYFFLF
jgi:hypothetical protein